MCIIIGSIPIPILIIDLYVKSCTVELSKAARCSTRKGVYSAWSRIELFERANMYICGCSTAVSIDAIL